MNVGFSSSCDDLLHLDFPGGVAVRDVISDTTVKQDWLLGDKAELGPQPLYVQSLQVLAVKFLYKR